MHTILIYFHSLKYSLSFYFDDLLLVMFALLLKLMVAIIEPNHYFVTCVHLIIVCEVNIVLF